LVFALPDRLQVLADRGMLSLMDATHDSNKLKWLLYTIMVRNQYGSYVPAAHILLRSRIVISWLWDCVKFMGFAGIDGPRSGY
jgi:hypothetical protein